MSFKSNSQRSSPLSTGNMKSNISPSITELFNDNPNVPILAYYAHEDMPIRIPWDRNPVTPGTGFDSGSNTSSPLRVSPFDLSSSQAVQLVVTEGNGLFRQTTSKSAATSYEHTDFGGMVSIGGSFLGASGRAEFSKEVLHNKDQNKTSVHASSRKGAITLPYTLHLSPSASVLLNHSATRPLFREKYGDYFVAGLYLGADNVTFLSSSSGVDVEAEMKDIQVKASFFGIKTTVYKDHKNTRLEGHGYYINLSGFDTLSGFHETGVKSTSEASYQEVWSKAAQNVEDGARLEGRIQGLMKEMNLDPGCSVSLSQCAGICQSGLVVELLLMPYSKLKDYIAVTSTYSLFSS